MPSDAPLRHFTEVKHTDYGRWLGVWADGPPGGCAHVLAFGIDDEGNEGLYAGSCSGKAYGTYAATLDTDTLEVDLLLNGMARTEQFRVSLEGGKLLGERVVVVEDRGPAGAPQKVTLTRRCP